MNKILICTLNFLWRCKTVHSLCTAIAVRQYVEHAHHWCTPKPRIAARQPLFIAASHYSSTHSFPLFLFAPFGDPAVDPKIGSFRPVPNHNYIRKNPCFRLSPEHSHHHSRTPHFRTHSRTRPRCRTRRHLRHRLPPGCSSRRRTCRSPTASSNFTSPRTTPATPNASPTSSAP